MFRALRHEWRVLSKSRPYLFLLVLLIFFALFAATLSFLLYLENHSYAWTPRMENGAFISNNNIAGNSLYNNWLGGRHGFDICATLLYFLMPVLAVLPFSASYGVELRGGYVRNMTTRVSRRTYFFAKYAATFFSGFSLFFLPLLVNFLAVACVYPAYLPDPSFMSAGLYGVEYGGAFSELFFRMPLLYAVIYLLVPSVFAGLWATVPMALAFFVRNKYVALFAPFLVLLFYTNVFDLLFVFRIYMEASPLYFLRGAGTRNTNNFWIMAAWFAGLFAFTFGTVMIKGRRDDVF